MMGEPCRVLHVLQRMEAAGVQTFLMNMYRKIDRTKVQFDFLVHYTAPQFFDEEVKRMGGRIYRFSVREDYDFIKYYSELDRFFREHTEYRVIHGHMHTLGAIYLHVAKKNKIPVRIAHAHTNSTQRDIKRIIKNIMNQLYAHDATDLFACSQAAGDYLFPNKEFCVINNAICSENFIYSSDIRKSKRKELGLEGQFVIGSIGRFELQKNQSFSVSIFEKVLLHKPDAKLLLIGSGSMLEEIKELVKNKNMEDNVIFLGNRRDVAELYQAMDIFLMPSLFEGLGIVAIEAQAAGTPVVCTDTLPKEIDVTPLVYRVSLKETEDVWAAKIEEAVQHPMCHMNTSSHIIESDYDMTMLANKMQEFYLSKYSDE